MKSFLPDKLYDVLVWIALVALDAVGVCYKTIAEIWHLPYGNEVLGTCAAVSLCLGILLGVSKAQYNKNNNVDISDFQSQEQTTFGTNAFNSIEGEVENVEEVSDSDECTDDVE